MSEVFAYKNLVDGTTYVFAEARPDLEARPNFERVDAGDVTDAQRDAALRAKAEADSIEASAKARNGEPLGSPVEGGGLLTMRGQASGVFDTITGTDKPKGGVLSRGVVKSPYSRVELEEKALADSEALATTGALAAHSSEDLTRVDLPARPQATVVSAEPVGTDTAKQAAKKAASPAVRKSAGYATPKGDKAGAKADA